MTKEDKESLLIEYKHMHDENWQRAHGIWLVNSILITSSVIAAFQSATEKPITYLVAIALVVAAIIIQATAGKITTLTYEKMKEIRKRLGMTETTKLYESKIQGRWWYILRINTAYALFDLLISAYLFLWSNRFFLSIAIFLAGIAILIIKEIFSSITRTIKKE